MVQEEAQQERLMDTEREQDAIGIEILRDVYGRRASQMNPLVSAPPGPLVLPSDSRQVTLLLTTPTLGALSASARLTF